MITQPLFPAAGRINMLNDINSRYFAAMYNTIVHKKTANTIEALRPEFAPMKDTPYLTLTSYEVSYVSYSKKNDRDVSGSHCKWSPQKCTVPLWRLISLAKCCRVGYIIPLAMHNKVSRLLAHCFKYPDRPLIECNLYECVWWQIST